MTVPPTIGPVTDPSSGATAGPTTGSTTDPASPGITKADIEAKLARLKGGVDAEIANVRGIAIAVGATVAVVVVLAVFALGRRRGRRFSTIVEIRRV